MFTSNASHFRLNRQKYTEHATYCSRTLAGGGFGIRKSIVDTAQQVKLFAPLRKHRTHQHSRVRDDDRPLIPPGMHHLNPSTEDLKALFLLLTVQVELHQYRLAAASLVPWRINVRLVLSIASQTLHGSVYGARIAHSQDQHCELPKFSGQPPAATSLAWLERS